MAKNPSSKQAAADDKGEKPFESCLAELEEIVAQLEAGEKPLDESLALYERGVAALKRCHGLLDKAEKRIRLLVKGSDGEPLVREGEVPRRGRAASASGEEEDSEISAGAENSAEQSVDGEAQTGQNLSPSVKPKSQAGGGKPGAGGSLFGHKK